MGAVGMGGNYLGSHVALKKRCLDYTPDARIRIHLIIDKDRLGMVRQ